MDWIRKHVRKHKDAEYAQRVLARYRLGMRARGAIRGVRIITGPDSCPTCQILEGTVYSLDEVPAIPIAGCVHSEGCRCAYTPVMTYEVRENGKGATDE